jgi:hypothetical protein
MQFLQIWDNLGEELFSLQDWGCTPRMINVERKSCTTARMASWKLLSLCALFITVWCTLATASRNQPAFSDVKLIGDASSALSQPQAINSEAISGGEHATVTNCLGLR